MAPSAEAKRLRLAQAQGASAPSKGFVVLSARAPRAAATSRMGLQAKRFLICAAFQDLAAHFLRNAVGSFLSVAHFLETPSAHFCRQTFPIPGKKTPGEPGQHGTRYRPGG